MLIGNIEYSSCIGSDINRDGMFVEINEKDSSVNPILEIFYSDQSKNMFITLFKADVPLAIVEWAIDIAYERLPTKL